MSKPTKEQIAQIQSMVDEAWVESCGSVTNDDLQALKAQILINADMILETQRRLMAVALVCFEHEEIEFSQILKRAAYVLTAFRLSSQSKRNGGGE